MKDWGFKIKTVELNFLRDLIACAKMDSDVEPENTELIITMAKNSGYTVIDDRSEEEKIDDDDMMRTKIANKAKAVLKNI
jgi:hypothetical protein